MLLMPAATTNRHATVSNPLLLKPFRPSGMSMIFAASIMASDPSIRTSGPATFFMSATKQQNMIPTVYHPSHASAMAGCAHHATFVAPIKSAPNVGAGCFGRDFQRTRRSSAQHG